MNFPKYARYCLKTFPAYRFIPGINPHPTEDPRGHSFGKHEISVEIFDPSLWAQNESYLYGVDLYNHGFWWESHEAWEGLWGVRPKNDPISQYLQGLIQISAAFIKWQLKEKKGVSVLFQSAMTYLQKARKHQQTYMGLDLDTHIKKLVRHFEPVISNEARWPDPLVDYPFIDLEGL